MELIYKIYEKNEELKMWDMWISRYPYMTKDNYQSFEEFKELCTGGNIDYTPTEVALKEIQEIENKISQQKGSEVNGDRNI